MSGLLICWFTLIIWPVQTCKGWKLRVSHTQEQKNDERLESFSCSHVKMALLGLNHQTLTSFFQDKQRVRGPPEEGHPAEPHGVHPAHRDLLHDQRRPRRKEPKLQALLGRRRGRGERDLKHLCHVKYSQK